MIVIASLVTFLSAFISAVIITPIAIRIGVSKGLADVPGGRRKHVNVTSRIGVVPLFFSFTLGLVVTQLFALPSNDQPNETWRTVGMLVGGIIIAVVGILDDKFQLSALNQLIAQVLVASIAIYCLIFIEEFRSPVTNQPIVLMKAFSIAISLIWFLGMMNTINIVDGVDGLAASIALIASIVTFIHMVREQQYSVALLPLALCGSLIGFLIFNLPPARIFLGGGSLYLGFTLACIGIVGGAKVALFLLVLGMPIADVAWQIMDRTRKRKSVVSADRGHLHLRLIDAGWSAKQVVIMYATAGVIFGSLALFVQPAIFKWIALVILSGGVILILLRYSQRKN